jgi:hypothetical protein
MSAAAKGSSCLACLIIGLIIQTIRRDRSGSVWIDGPSNLSRPDPPGPDQIDAEHQATDLEPLPGFSPTKGDMHGPVAEGRLGLIVGLGGQTYRPVTD